MKKFFRSMCIFLLMTFLFFLVSCSAEPSDPTESTSSESSTEQTVITTEEMQETTANDTLEDYMYNKFLEDGPDDGTIFLTGSTTKNPLSYEIGEKITFHISLVSGKNLLPCKQFIWTLMTEGGKTESGTADGTEGWFEVSTVLERPGSVQLTVQAYDENGQVYPSTYTGGAAANVKEITLAKDEPADFDDFWSEKIKELDKLGLQVLKYEMVKENASFYIYDVRLNAIGDMPVSGYLSIPKNAAPGKCKAKLAFQGYSCEGSSMFFEKNTILFSVNIHGLENGQDTSYYQQMNQTVCNGFGFSSDRISYRDTSDYLYLHLRNLQAVRFIKTFEEWNGKDLIVSGGSCGAMQSIALAALDSDISQVSVWIPWLCDVGGYTAGRIKSTFAPNYVDAMGYFDTVSFARRITCNIGISAGLGDKVIPLSGVLALINNLTNTESTEFIFQQHDTHGYIPPMILEYSYDLKE